MYKNGKHIIWSSDINLEDWEDALMDDCLINEENYDELSEWDKYQRATDINDWYLDDERVNLNISVPEGIIAIADIGRWNGRVSGYKEIGYNLSDCLVTDYDSATWFVDAHGRLRAVFADHDGQTLVLYKAWRSGISDDTKRRVLDAIYNGECTEALLRRYTRNIGGKVAEIYGWNVATGKKNK